MVNLNELISSIEKSDLDIGIRVAEMLATYDDIVSEKLHISKKDLKMVLNNSREVSHVVFKDQLHPFRTSSKLLKNIAIVGFISFVFLIPCLAVPGFADSIHYTIITTFARPTLTRVEAITYERSSKDLSGCILPSNMLQGYEIVRVTHPTDSDMVEIVYANLEGTSIKYYYYPDDIVSNYDREKTEFESLKLKDGTANIGYTSEGNVVMYFLHDSGFVHMEFEEEVSINELSSIANSLCLFE